jgi:hypothetical protein
MRQRKGYYLFFLRKVHFKAKEQFFVTEAQLLVVARLFDFENLIFNAPIMGNH